MNLQQLITSICLGKFYHCRSQTVLCCVRQGHLQVRLAQIVTRICQLCVISVRDSGTTAPHFIPGLANCKPHEGHIIRQGLNWGPDFCVFIYTACHRRNGPNFGRVFLMLNYTDISQNTYIQSWTITEIMAREKCGHLAFPRNVRLQLWSALTVRLWRHKLRPTR